MPYNGLSKGREVKLDDRDLAALKQQIDDIELAEGTTRLGSRYVTRGPYFDSYQIIGMPPILGKVYNYVVDGRFINELDMRERRKVAAIGPRVQEVLFADGEDPIGRLIRIQGVFYKVVGIYRSPPGSSGSERDVENIVIPITTSKQVFGLGMRNHTLVITPKSGVTAKYVEDKAKTLLKLRHDVDPDDPSAIGSFNIQEEYDKVQTLFAGINVFSWLVAIGTILAGVIGVGNIMLIAVNERTREIGIRKALGAQPSSIVAMILQEALVLTSVAGCAGLVAGVCVVELLALVTRGSADSPGFFRHPEVSLQTALTAILVLVVAGSLAALLPAAKAAKINPVVALQEE